MASVKSLGIHEPTGLQYLVEEQLVPLEDPKSHYKWDVIPDSTKFSGDSTDTQGNDDDTNITDELLITRGSVVWARGYTFRKCFRFDLEKEPVTHALLAYFPISADSRESSAHKGKAPQTQSTDSRALSKALVVFLRTQAHIFFLDGTSHIVHMPFEVESACAAPRGIIIQRKLRMDNAAPVTLKFPRVPPNSFVSSQLSLMSVTPTQQTFSTEGLGRPKTLPLRLSTSVGHMWESPVVHADSHWPRLVCLTDPLLEMGLVVTQADPPTEARRRYSGKGPYFLDPGEEILHIETIQTVNSNRDSDDSLTIAVSLNRDANTYTVWRLSYLTPDDTPFTKPKKPVHKPNKRRSSMQPGILSASTTPIQPNFRESFGAPMPGKRGARKSERREKPVDIASTIQADKDGGVARRQSRRVSSMLARTADLSTSQDRSIFDGAKRVDSHASQYHRQSSGIHGSFILGGLNPPQTHLEAPVDDLLDELRSGGDFEGFHTMGINDHDFEGLSQEILFSKIHSVSIETTSVRYSSSAQPAKAQCKVFVIVGPPFAADEQQHNQVLIGIQDPLDKRLQLLSFHLQKQRRFDLNRSPKKLSTPQAETTTLSWNNLRKAQDVIDSCKIVDGDISMILILSRGHSGNELSIQAPWSRLTPIALPPLTLHNPNNPARSPLSYSEGSLAEAPLPINSSNIVAICNSTSCGLVDAKDQNRNYHQLRIQLQPTSSYVKKVLDACRSVLPASHAEQVLAGWWSIMQWLKAENAPFPDYEWSCTTVLLLVIYLGLGLTESSTLMNVPRRNLQGDIFASFTMDGDDDLSDWEKMQTFETPNSSVFPGWMQNKAWEWMLIKKDGELTGPEDTSQSLKTDFISRHITYAKQFVVSATGLEAIGAFGYLPTAIGRGKETRRSAAWAIFLALHALMEDEKLDIMLPEYQSPGRADLRVLMCQIARWLNWPSFAALYELGLQADVDLTHDDELSLNPPIPEPFTQFCVFDWIQANLAHEVPAMFMTLSQVYYMGSKTSEVDQAKDRRWEAITPRTFMFQSLFDRLDLLRKKHKTPAGSLQIVEALHAYGFRQQVLETLPEAVLTPLLDAIAQAQPRPPPTWPKDLLELINRSDVSMMLASDKPPRRTAASLLKPTHTATWDYSVLCKSVDEFTNVGYNEDGGVERQAVIRALFKDDRRLDEAKNVLSTSRPRVVRLDPETKWTESQYLEKQKELVTRIAIGTLAIPSGRGLLFYSLRFPLLTQKYAIQGFNLNCIVQPTNTTVGVDKSMYAEEKVSWAFFHQGVAGGLAISPQAKGIDTSWILYNKPGQDLSNRHAGFLLALGLNGHLKSVAKWVAFKYLTPKHTMTSIGLLLGLAASYLGTMDSLITRLLSVHVTRMLPRGAAELNLSPLTQTTGILGIGLLYANTQHRRMSEIMVSEIAHIDVEEEEEPLRSECYRLAAGFALGLINLARGDDLRGLSDMRLTENLLSLATSTKKVDVVQILDRGAAPATIAIALIFMRTEDPIVARKIDVPDSTLQFEYIRPDVLLLRTLAKNLILWSKIEPSFRWIRTSLPQEYQTRHRLGSVHKLVSTDLPFFAIVAGLCFAMALRYSGAADVRVRDLLVHYLDQLLRISRLKAEGFDARLARAGTAMALDTLALSAAIVMAGTGDLVVLRRLRALHGREENMTTYGSHLAAHLATGALFLGSGTKTFGSSPMATASLVMAFYPVWPGHVMDNRAHLQAARHFWTLAVEERCLVAREVTGGVVSAGVVIKLKKPETTKENEAGQPFATAGVKPAHRSTITAFPSTTLPTIEGTPVTPVRSPQRVVSPPPMEADEEGNEPEVLRLTTPTLLPPLHTISSIQTVAAPTFWNLTLDFDHTPGLRDMFAAGGMNLYLRRRPGTEGPLEGTIRALGSNTKTPFGAPDPLEWIFDLEALNGLTTMERNAVLGTGDEGNSSTGSGGLAQAVDARLVLKEVASGRSREDLLGLRLLFAWEAERQKRLKEAEAEPDNAEEDSKGKKVRISAGGDVIMDNDAEEDAPETAEDEDGDWWLRSTVVDEIKGKVYLGGQA
ncbi:uncharacterized protein MKZ38_010406 [Zalerion maritima]|uniref:Anaphase-promoting complex subunit 1 N-terminal domain-containing protein n=1 Tax=Zalerion maritima TaxID=339359 RepID=A0AAD5RU80_9PEZI|nr:uncharacterized protein MKZ38_010406 [Zalerion maritima]